MFFVSPAVTNHQTVTFMFYQIADGQTGTRGQVEFGATWIIQGM